MLTSLDFLKKGNPWPPKQELPRLSEYYENIALRNNNFSVWNDLSRYLREDAKKELLIYFGYWWLLTKKINDFLWGVPPIITGPSDDQTAYLNAIITSNNLLQVDKEVAADVASLGTGLYKLYKDAKGFVSIQCNCPDVWFPVVDRSNIRSTKYHVIATEFLDKEENTHLKVEIHSKDLIENQVWKIEKSIAAGMTPYLGEQEDLVLYYPNLLEIEPNPIGEFLVVPCHNLRVSTDIVGRSDFSADLKKILKAMCEAYARQGRILEKHTDPNIVAPKNTFTEWDPVQQKQIARAGGRLIEYDHDPGTIAPSVYYLESSSLAANTGAQDQLIQRYKNEFMALAEFPSIMLASEDVQIGALTGPAMRLRMSSFIAKIQRYQVEFTDSLQQLLWIASLLDDREVWPIDIKWQDPLPTIPTEDAQILSMLANLPAFSGESGMAYLLQTFGRIEATKAQELARESVANKPMYKPLPFGQAQAQMREEE